MAGTAGRRRRCGDYDAHEGTGARDAGRAGTGRPGCTL